jgi:hypothetical protein
MLESCGNECLSCLPYYLIDPDLLLWTGLVCVSLKIGYWPQNKLNFLFPWSSVKNTANGIQTYWISALNSGRPWNKGHRKSNTA